MQTTKTLELSQATLDLLKHSNGTMPDSVHDEISRIMYKLGGRGIIRSLDWNETIDWLDENHPGWRGYQVEYVDGRVA